LIVGAGGRVAAVVGIFEHAVDGDAVLQLIGGRGRVDVVVGVEGADAVLAGGLLVVAVGPAETEELPRYSDVLSRAASDVGDSAFFRLSP
jgi:hypothetical protein